MQHTRRTIRTALFTLSALLVTAAGADTVIHNVRGYTLADDALEQFTYLHVDDDGRVVEAGNGEAPAARTRIDAGGAVMLPGLIDAHGHVSSLGLAMSRVDLVGTRSLDEALARIGAFAEANPNLEWITGRGWNQELWTVAEFPSAADIDAVVADRPVYLGRIDGHAAWANTAALRAAGIDANTRPPPGGDIHRDANGRATGILIDDAMTLVTRHIPEPDQVARMTAIGRAMEALAAVGLTAVHDAGIHMNDVRAYEALHALDAMPIRIYAMLDGIKTVRSFGPPAATDDEQLIVRSMKLVSDGALGSRGAAMDEPYSDDPENHGLLIIDEAALTAQIGEARKAGYQVNVHAIGDRANRVVLDAYEAVGATAAERHRNEHAQVVHVEDIPRFIELGIVPSMQPTHATSDKNMAEKRVGADRLKGAYAWRTFLDQGSRIAGGSDFPVENANPFWGLYAAVTRQGLDGEPPGGWVPEQRMTREEAFRAFTLDAAWAAHMEDTTGSLEPGKWADFILVDADPFEVDEQRIADIGVLETWVAGERVWRASTGSD